MDQFQQQSPANQNANYPPQVAIPRANLPTDRSFIKIFLVGLITFGIYPLIAYNSITNDVNTICTRYDNKKSMNYVLLVLVITPLTLGIASLVWNHNIANRVGNELRRRGAQTDFGASTFWLWSILGMFIAVGPFIYMYKFVKATNELNSLYNESGI